DHRAADQDGDHDADDRHDRDQGVLHHVAANDALFTEPFGPRGPDVVLPQHLEHHGARDAHQGSAQHQPQKDSGQQELQQVAFYIPGHGDVLQWRRPAPPDGRVDHDHRGNPERRYRQEDDGYAG